MNFRHKIKRKAQVLCRCHVVIYYFRRTFHELLNTHANIEVRLIRICRIQIIIRVLHKTADICCFCVAQRARNERSVEVSLCPRVIPQKLIYDFQLNLVFQTILKNYGMNFFLVSTG